MESVSLELEEYYAVALRGVSEERSYAGGKQKLEESSDPSHYAAWQTVCGRAYTEDAIHKRVAFFGRRR